MGLGGKKRQIFMKKQFNINKTQLIITQFNILQHNNYYINSCNSQPETQNSRNSKFLVFNF